MTILKECKIIIDKGMGVVITSRHINESVFNTYHINNIGGEKYIIDLMSFYDDIAVSTTIVNGTYDDIVRFFDTQTEDPVTDIKKCSDEIKEEFGFGKCFDSLSDDDIFDYLKAGYSKQKKDNGLYDPIHLLLIAQQKKHILPIDRVKAKVPDIVHGNILALC